MEKNRNYRHELKFEIPYGEYVALRTRLRLIMKPDPHVREDGRYRIRSIYFDNSDDKALREKIDGTIPSTDAGQKADSSSLVDGSGIDIAAMGQFSMGGFGGGNGGFGGFGGGNGGSGDKSGDGQTEESGNNASSGRPDMGDFDPSNMPGGFSQGGSSSSEGSGSDGSSGSDSSSRPSSFPGSFSGSGMPGSSVNTSKIQNTISIVVCFVVVIVALVVLKFIKPKG